MALVSAVAIVGIAASAWADARSDYLIRALRTSDMFRVRARAAISLGTAQADPAVVGALSAALGDDHHTVRAAAASSLERLGDPSALRALRRAARDSDPRVRTAVGRAVAALERIQRTQPRRRGVPNSGGSAPAANARFYVAVGRPGTKVRTVSRGVLDSAREFTQGLVRGTAGVRLAPDSERPRAAQQVMRQDSLVGYYLDISIVAIEDRPNGGLRARVSVVVQTYPGRNVRSMLNGAATVMGASGDSARQQAIEGALRGALRGLPQAMEASAATAQSSRPAKRRRRRRRR